MTRHYAPSRAPQSEDPEPIDPGYDPSDETMSDDEYNALMEPPRLGASEEFSLAHLYNTARIEQQQKRGKG